MPRPLLAPATWNRVIVAAWLGGFALVRAGSPEERDPYWQARAGLESLAGAPVARPDSWSWAPVADLFYPNSPGWNLVLGLAWRAGGYWGLFWLAALTIGAYLGLAYLLARRLGARPLPALAGLVAVTLLAWPMLNARATVPVQILLLVALAFPGWWVSRPAVPGSAATAAASFGVGAVTSGLGNWLHLSWLTWTPLVAGAWAVFWLALVPLLEPGRRPRGRGWAALAGVAGLAAGLATTPFGLAGGVQRTLATQQASQGLFLEWVSPFVTGSPRWIGVAVALLAAGVVLAAGIVRRLRRRPLSPDAALATTLALVGLPSIVGGLVAIRFVGVAALVLAPLAAVLATRLADGGRRAALSSREAGALGGFVRRWTQGHPWRVVLTGVAVVLLPAVVARGPLPHAVPAEAAAVAQLPSGCRLMASNEVAAVAILTRPDVPVWIDSRADYYGRARLLEFADYLGRRPARRPARNHVCRAARARRPRRRPAVHRPRRGRPGLEPSRPGRRPRPLAAGRRLTAPGQDAAGAGRKADEPPRSTGTSSSR